MGLRMRLLLLMQMKRRFTQPSRSLMLIWEKKRELSCSVVYSVGEKMYSLVDGIARQRIKVAINLFV